MAGMENGDLDIWDPSKIVANAESALKYRPLTTDQI